VPPRPSPAICGAFRVVTFSESRPIEIEQAAGPGVCEAVLPLLCEDGVTTSAKIGILRAAKRASNPHVPMTTTSVGRITGRRNTNVSPITANFDQESVRGSGVEIRERNSFV